MGHYRETPFSFSPSHWLKRLPMSVSFLGALTRALNEERMQPMTAGVDTFRTFHVLYAFGADPRFVSKNGTLTGTILGVSLALGMEVYEATEEANDCDSGVDDAAVPCCSSSSSPHRSFLSSLIRSNVVDFDVPTPGGLTPFLDAILMNEDAAIAMYECGADPRIRSSSFQRNALLQGVRWKARGFCDRVLLDVLTAKAELGEGRPSSVWWLPTEASIYDFINDVDRDQRTALMIARQEKYPEIVDRLRALGSL